MKLGLKIRKAGPVLGSPPGKEGGQRAIGEVHRMRLASARCLSTRNDLRRNGGHIGGFAGAEELETHHGRRGSHLFGMMRSCGNRWPMSAHPCTRQQSAGRQKECAT